MAKALIIDAREKFAELLSAVLVESGSAEVCQTFTQQDDGFAGHLSGGYSGLIKEQRIDTIVYAPKRTHERSAPDLTDAETLFQECARTRLIKRFTLISSAEVYGSSPHNTGFLTESHLLPQGRRCRIAASWFDLESLAVSYFGEDSGTRLAILRTAPAPTHGGDDYFSSLFSRRIAFALPGHDPTLQILSLEDLAQAIRCAIDKDAEGIYNVAPEGVITLRAALRLCRVRRAPVARTLQRVTRAALAPTALAYASEQLDYIRYSWTVSNEKIKRELGFIPQHTSYEALLSFAASQANDVRRAKNVSLSGGRQALSKASAHYDVSQERRVQMSVAFETSSRRIEDGLSHPSNGNGEAHPSFDDFGMDEKYIAAFGRTLFKFLHDRYWRVEVKGLSNVPREGSAVLVGSHRGFMPWDAVMALHLIKRETGRCPRFLIHPGLIKFPFLFNFHTKLGGVVACQENADRILMRDELLAIYPEGIRGAFTMYRDAYRLCRFGRDDFVRIALRNRAPIVPFVNVGSAEIFPILAKIEWNWWKRYTEWPFFPITPTWPLLPLPLPSKWHTQYLEPMHIEKRYPPEAANDPSTVHAISRDVKARMEGAIKEILGRRKNIFFGSVFDEEKRAVFEERAALKEKVI